MRTALKDQKEANLALRAYIDNILLNIVEHYPQLLEVKHNNNGFNNACHNNKGKEGKGGSNEKVIHWRHVKSRIQKIFGKRQTMGN